jgi:hypothetical protein
MFVPVQFLRNWREQRPSNKGDLDWIVTGEAGRVYYRGWTCFWFHFIPQHVIVVGLRFKWCALYNINVIWKGNSMQTCLINVTTITNFVFSNLQISSLQINNSQVPTFIHSHLYRTCDHRTKGEYSIAGRRWDTDKVRWLGWSWIFGSNEIAGSHTATWW